MKSGIENPLRRRLWILIVLLLATFVGIVLAVDPIPQDPAYHLFADHRAILGIANFSNVVSNAGFALAAVLGIVTIAGRTRGEVFAKTDDAQPYAVFFIGVALVSVGSAFYHLEPTTDRLLWDRLPMSIAFMAFGAAVVADRIHARAGNTWLLALLVAAGVLSLVYWAWTESLGRGDLRFYGFVQFYPVLALPLILWLFPRHRYTAGRYIVWIILWYGLAKVLEHFDHQVFEFFGGTLSGHTLKHLAAAVATLVVWRMLVACRQDADQSRNGLI